MAERKMARWWYFFGLLLRYAFFSSLWTGFFLILWGGILGGFQRVFGRLTVTPMFFSIPLADILFLSDLAFAKMTPLWRLFLFLVQNFVLTFLQYVLTSFYSMYLRFKVFRAPPGASSEENASEVDSSFFMSIIILGISEYLIYKALVFLWLFRVYYFWKVHNKILTYNEPGRDALQEDL